MRYLRLASEKNPDDSIDLNGHYFDEANNKGKLHGYFCTSFQTLGTNRKIEYLKIKNRQTAVENQLEFKDYSLSIEIIPAEINGEDGSYIWYESYYEDLRRFIDRNKKHGFRLYYTPYFSKRFVAQSRYILCDLKSSSKIEKRQPVQIVLTQKSLWLGDEKIERTTATKAKSQSYEFKENRVVKDESYLYDENGVLIEDLDLDDTNSVVYYSANFSLDEEIENYYRIRFSNPVTNKASIIIDSYNETPLVIRINGRCSNPFVRLFRLGESYPIKTTRLLATVEDGYYLEIDSNVFTSGVWLVSPNGERTNYADVVDNSYGSPYFILENGEYVIEVDDGQSSISAEIRYIEEYSG